MKKIISLLIIVLLIIILIDLYVIKQSNTPSTKKIEISKTLQMSDNEKKESFQPFSAVNQTDQITISCSNDNTDAVKSLDEAQVQREVFQDLQSRMTEQTQDIPACLELATTQTEALTCTQELRALNHEFALLLGIEDDIDPKNPQVEKSFIWNETTKENMINELDEGIVVMQEMFECIENAPTEKEQKQCFEMK